jgi:hypothetical protein
VTHVKRILVAAVLTLGLSTLAIRAQKFGGGPPAPPIMKALDLNGDGTIDADEIAKAPESLKTIDKNGDGTLSSDELRPARPEGAGGPGGQPPDMQP